MDKLKNLNLLDIVASYITKSNQTLKILRSLINNYYKNDKTKFKNDIINYDFFKLREKNVS